MALLQAVGNTVQWIVFVGALLVPGVVATVCWAPLLASKRLRSLFAKLPPFESPYATYVLFGIAASLPYVFGLLGALATADIGRSVFTVTLIVSAGYVVGIPVVGVVGLPRLGVDWDPTGYGATTWLLLVVGGLWYAVLFAVPLTALSVVFSLP